MSSAPARKYMPPAPLVALVAWLIPGAGYLLIGQRARGLTVGITIFLLFISGLLIGGIRVIDCPWIESPAQTAERLRREENGKYHLNPVQALLQKPWFIGQALAGPIAFVTNKIGVSWERPAPAGTIPPEDSPPDSPLQGAPFSHSRVYEIGTLYTAVAGMLNLLAIIDAAYRASNHGHR